MSKTTLQSYVFLFNCQRVFFQQAKKNKARRKRRAQIVNYEKNPLQFFLVLGQLNFHGVNGLKHSFFESVGLLAVEQVLFGQGKL